MKNPTKADTMLKWFVYAYALFCSILVPLLAFVEIASVNVTWDQIVLTALIASIPGVLLRYSKKFQSFLGTTVLEE